MAHGQSLFSRRGKPAKFHAGSQKEWLGSTPTGEWVAVHCGQNEEHLNNESLMAAVRERWPSCPSDEELRAQQRSILGLIHFVEGDLPAADVQDFFMDRYTCTKTAAWRGDAAKPCAAPLAYPKGNLQVWRLNREGFEGGEEQEGALLTLLEEALAGEIGGDSGGIVEAVPLTEDEVPVEEAELPAKVTKKEAKAAKKIVKPKPVKEKKEKKKKGPGRGFRSDIHGEVKVKKEDCGVCLYKICRCEDHRRALAAAAAAAKPAAKRAAKWEKPPPESMRPSKRIKKEDPE